MAIARFKVVALAAAFAAVGLAGTPAGAADSGPLSALSGPLAEAGYGLTWKSMTLDPTKGRVTAKGVSSTDAAGRVVARVGSVSMDRPRAVPGGGWSADALTLERVEVPGPSPLTIRRVVVTRPDLQAVARLLAAFAEPAAPGRHDRPLEIERLDLHGLSGQWIDGDGERLAVTVETLQATGLRVDPAAFAAGGDPDRLRPFAVLAGVQLGLLEAHGLRSRSSLSGSTEVARQWVRNSAEVPGQSGRLEYGSEGIRMHPEETDATTPFLASLFPPAGEVLARWSGAMSYDVARGFLGQQQRTELEGFGVLEAHAEILGLPDLTVGEWESVEDGDPRLAATVVDGFSVSVTDVGGVERVIAALAEDDGTPPAGLRDAFAAEFGAIGQGFNPGRDPVVAAWLQALQDFVRIGGTLALAAERPIPIEVIADQELETGRLPELVARYGLSLQRR